MLCIVVHFQPVKLLQKSVRVHHRRVMFDAKNAKFFWGGGTAPPPVGRRTPLPTPHPLGAWILTPPILKFCLRYWTNSTVR